MRYIYNKHHSGILKSNLEIKILIVSGLNMPIKKQKFSYTVSNTFNMKKHMV